MTTKTTATYTESIFIYIKLKIYFRQIHVTNMRNGIFYDIKLWVWFQISPGVGGYRGEARRRSYRTFALKSMQKKKKKKIEIL